MFCPPSEVMNLDNRWATELTGHLDKKPVLALMCSLLNTILTYDPIGWANLPYKHLLFGDSGEMLVINCIRLLVPILDYRSNLLASNLSSESLNLTDVSGASSSTDPTYNLFRSYIKKIQKPADLDFMLNGITTLFRNPIDVYLLKRLRAHICLDPQRS
jgi:hypothetical protein